MAQTDEDARKMIREMLEKATDLTENKWVYTNQVQINISANEAILDLYVVGPDPLNIGKPAVAARIQRVIMPVSIAKETAELILDAISRWENAFGITLPIDPQENIVPRDETTS